MSATAKILGFLVALLAVFAAAISIGRAVGPVDVAAPVEHGDMAGEVLAANADAEGGENSAPSLPKGLMVSQDGYTFRLARDTARAGATRSVSFAIERPDGEVVTDYDLEHEKRLHLIAVRRDFAGFQHVHPEMSTDGTWTATLDLAAGHWRLFADFKATGAEALVLGNDLAVRGEYTPAPTPADTRTALVDGYTVTLDGNLKAGEEAKLTLGVARDGEPVTDLQPYLGAYGHLVALRAGDLAYLHVHPDGAPGDGRTQPGPEVVFYAEVPSADRYQLYLDFKHEGVVRTAAFTVTGSGSVASEPAVGDESDAGHGDDDAH